ncbi:response regulator transcription factor [Raineyella sp. LH-20]|uniref:response regulator transcription factor n=1 Tax=Raineyella sp. LH-20 TaxID=3081204 RepID=UPI0029551F32|nr:response regulator transcription factor [Raineyella sp. LH-20]WOP19467.1 response regulator transcription factor [Raineyella sp. LH-20]
MTGEHGGVTGEQGGVTGEQGGTPRDRGGTPQEQGGVTGDRGGGAPGATYRRDMDPTGDATPRVLVVDDEKALARMVASYLDRAGYLTRLEHTGPDALAAVRSWAPDVVILDLGLPGMDGMEVCRQLRRTSDAYVIMLTARDDEFDTLMGFAAGADDYVTKPFSTRTLVSRVQAVLRRPRTRAEAAAGREFAPGGSAGDTVGQAGVGQAGPRGSEGPGGADGRDERTAAGPSVPDGPSTAVEADALERTFGGLRIDVAGHEAFLDGERLALTPTEFSLLLTLSERPRWAFSRRRLLDAVWGEHWVGDDHLVDVHIANLRRKLGDDPERPRFVLTVRGVGYRMGRG